MGIGDEKVAIEGRMIGGGAVFARSGFEGFPGAGAPDAEKASCSAANYRVRAIFVQ